MHSSVWIRKTVNEKQRLKDLWNSISDPTLVHIRLATRLFRKNKNNQVCLGQKQRRQPRQYACLGRRRGGAWDRGSTPTAAEAPTTTGSARRWWRSSSPNWLRGGDGGAPLPRQEGGASSWSARTPSEDDDAFVDISPMPAVRPSLPLLLEDDKAEEENE
jgi:hypothetical protein